MSEALYITNSEQGLDAGPTKPQGGLVEHDKAWVEAEAMRPHMDTALKAKQRGEVALAKLAELNQEPESAMDYDYMRSAHQARRKGLVDEAQAAVKDEKISRGFANGQAYWVGSKYDAEQGLAAPAQESGSIPLEILAQIPDDPKGLKKFEEENLAQFDPSKVPLWAAYLAKRLKRQASFATDESIARGLRYPGNANGVLGNGASAHYLRAALGEMQGKQLEEKDLAQLPFSEVARAFGFDVKEVVPDYERRFSEEGARRA